MSATRAETRRGGAGLPGGWKKGGKARAEKLAAEQRSESARKAAMSWWADRKSAE